MWAAIAEAQDRNEGIQASLINGQHRYSENDG